MSKLASFFSAFLLLVSGCTGATVGSGVGDAMLQHPPYYAGAASAHSVQSVARLPIAWQSGASDLPIFEPKSKAGSPVARLVNEMNAYLDSLWSASKVGGAAIGSAPGGTPPDVSFGCNVRYGDDCEDGKEQGLLERGGPRMRLSVGRPSSDWISAAAREAEAFGASHVLVITLEAGQYFLRQQGWQGRKVVELGTNHHVSQPWLTSLDKPVNVIQLTGALVGRDGKAQRIGVEGLMAKRTGLVMSSLGAQALITDGDVETLRTARRDDLPARPLVWQEALRTLVERLTQ
jgi:hypothetical protein